MVFTSSCIYREQSYPLSAFSLLGLASPLANGSGAETSHCESRKNKRKGCQSHSPGTGTGGLPKPELVFGSVAVVHLFALQSDFQAPFCCAPFSSELQNRHREVSGAFLCPGKRSALLHQQRPGGPCRPCLAGSHSAPAAPAEAGVLLITPSLPTGTLVPLLAGGSVTARRQQTGDDSQHAMRPSKRAGPRAPRRAFASSTVTAPPWPDSPRLDFIICYKMRVFHIVLNRLNAASR